MINTVFVVGRVVEVVPDRDAILVVVRTGSGEKRGGGAWTEDVACRFYGDAKKYTDSVRENALVRVDGSVKSRKGERGWFTAFEARYLTTVNVGAQPASRGEPPKLWNEPKAPADDSSDDPF